MYLKSLQVVGFKSFADRTSIQFDPGVTAIVGPNGCGKSNVLDAVRWVLGEQSAKALRGGSMQDVIFSGTDRRKPLGLAEVSLTFGDCERELGTEFNEVTVTRRVFRDGQSEYEMNKTPCRLKDIHQLFMDTGIGRTAYSIMEQGKIDQILSSKPEDRRAIFEEAAGITKYKSQKREAMRKLEQMDANLLRLADIIAEVERQTKSLQRQVAKARRYQERIEELRGMETRFARNKFDQASAEIVELQAAVDASHGEQRRLQTELDAQELALRSAREELMAIDTRLAEIRDEHGEIRAALERAEHREKTNDARVSEFNDLRQRALLELATTEERIRAQEEQLGQITEALRRSEAGRNATRESVEQIEEQAQMLTARVHSLENERSGFEEISVRLERTIAGHRGELSSLDLQQKSVLFRFEQLRAERSGIQARLAEIEARLAERQTALAVAEVDLGKRREDVERDRQVESALAGRLREAQSSHAEATHKLQALSAKREALEQLAVSHAGTSEATQEVLRAATKGTLDAKIHGTLSDHFSVRPGYEEPIALLLGDAINTLIVENRASAETILGHLREQADGGAVRVCSLLPLDLARPAPPSNPHPSHALQFINADPVAQPLLETLLADAHIVDDLLSAYAFRLTRPEAVIATQRGELITRAGVVAVGRKDGASLSVLTRYHELRELGAAIEQAEASVASSSWLVTEAEAQLAAAREATGAAQSRLQAHEIAMAEHRQELKAVDRAGAELQGQIETANREIDVLSERDQTGHARQAELRAFLARDEAELAATQEKNQALSAQIDGMADQEDELASGLIEAKVRLATQQQQCEGWQAQREPVANRLLELRELVEIRTRESDDYAARIEQAKFEITQSRADREELTARLETIQARGASAMEARSQAQSAIDDRESALRETRRDLSDLQSGQSAKEVALEKQKMQLEALRQRIRGSYQLELEDLPPLGEEDAETDWDIIEADVAERRAQIDAMGPVNLDAIGEYEELEQRFQFLTAQQQDLVNGKADLLKTIAHINQTTKKLFAETFEQIKVNFHEMFTALFGGGKATLVLLDTDNPLECGIDVVAKPPGKQLQSITLLSGGEKTMTAVALLFSIYMVKPSPFCVLDEMDAPLDESNISRFIKMLDRFASQSQFVVITHNKRTISRADALYGVTMEEHGVSKIVSVRLNREKKSNGNGNSADHETSAPPVPHHPGFAEDPAIPSIAESFGKATELKV
jgi:chromosome segregation protein